jgi:hypothetical protein
MKSSRTKDFRKLFVKLPQRIKETAKKNYELWKENPFHFQMVWLSRDRYQPYDSSCQANNLSYCLQANNISGFRYNMVSIVFD